MSQPKISVVIPTLNEEKYLSVCLESFKKQTFSDFEIIISDGGSIDKTIEIAKKYTNKIIVIEDSNVCLARDKGTRLAQGEVIVGTDADTFYPPNHLEIILSEFQKNKDTVAVTGKIKIADCPIWWIPIWKLTYSLVEIIYKITGVVLYAPALNLSFRKDAFLKAGGYNTRLDFGGDELDFLGRLKGRGKIVFTNLLCPTTSGRRYKVGFFVFFFKHALFYYWLSYLSGKILGRSLIRAKPVR